MESSETSQTLASIIIGWLPLVIYVGTWIWGVLVFKRYARSRERLTAEATAATRELVGANRQIATTLAEFKTEFMNRKI